MMIPSDVVTRHKIRDSKILSLYSRDSYSFAEIGIRFKISATRVGQIIYKNRHLLKIDQQFEKTKRINKLNRILAKKPETCIMKDAVDILDKLRIETEGKDGSAGAGNPETKVIIIREAVTNGNPDPGGTIPRPLSILRI